MLLIMSDGCRIKYQIMRIRGMSRISGLPNEMKKRTFYKERRINKIYIHFLSKQNIKAPIILDLYVKSIP